MFRDGAALFFDTLRGLAAPRRAVPIALVALPLLAAQHELSANPSALPVGLFAVVIFLLAGPWSFRALVASPVDHTRSRLFLPLRIGLYAVIGSIPAAIAWLTPELFGTGRTFLAQGVNLFVATGLFWVGGFGLGRDLDLEQRWLLERRRAEGLAKEAERAQLLALRSHLDPHFLFNTLNAIAEWCREDAAVAERAVLDLSAMLRDVLAGVQCSAWPLSDELRLAERLFELHRMRDPGRFEARIEVDPALLGTTVPPLILLPLAENAMKHGPGRGHRGLVTLRAERVQAGLQIELQNPGEFSCRRTGGEGLPLVERRLSLAYGERASLRIGGSDGTTRAVLVLPFESGEEER